MGGAKRVRRIIKVRVGDAFDGTLIRLLSQSKEPRLGSFGWDEFMYIEVEQEEA